MVELELIPILLALFTLAVTVFAFKLIFRSSGALKVPGESLILCGDTGAGKTALMYKLTKGAFVKTVTSMETGHGRMSLGERQISIVDIPGHPRVHTDALRSASLHKNAKAIVFVVDAGTVTRDVQRVTELLFDIVTLQCVARSAVPVLIACNKQDQLRARSANDIESLIQKEMDVLRRTRAEAVQSLSADQQAQQNSQQHQLRVAGDHFTFRADLPAVTFAECSVKNVDNESRLSEVTQWIKSNV